MRSKEAIRINTRLTNIKVSVDGGMGIIVFPHWRGTVIWSDGAGWEHVSVSPLNRRYTPSWDDMQSIKEIFWTDDEAVIQIHPEKKNYVNNMGNCLHLWRCTYKVMVLPPSCLVGIRPGQTMEELQKEVEEAYRLSGEASGR